MFSRKGFLARLGTYERVRHRIKHNTWDCEELKCRLPEDTWEAANIYVVDLPAASVHAPSS